ncbi:MAG TPA: FAD-dependent oxidoreductase [Solirubrobacteraceae bacterium]|nr:FAD-dependent oxidoreductase [Solirubrobacteraceae bacterium]
MTDVAILGGGVAGLTAAHELAERGFGVTVLEARAIPGGKARSLPVPNSGTGGRPDLPAEHGFRFFPGFYRHLPDTMGRIPLAGDTVAERLTGATRILLAQAGGRNEVIAAAHAPESLDDLGVLSRFLLEVMTGLGIPAAEHAWLMDRILTLLTSCDARRYEQWDLQSWWVYVRAEERSAAFRKFLADGLTRTLVAARAREISARTGGLILAQLVFDLTRAGGRADRVLDAPTNEAWIDPWVAHLGSLGVDLRLNTPVEGVTVREGRIHTVTTPAGTVTADYYVAALPVEVFRLLAGPPLRALEPKLAALDRLATRWMNGVLFYLDRDVPLVHGHAIYIDSEWALTSISQAQFWREDVSGYGDGRVKGVLSVDVSDWQMPGRRTGKVAARCSREDIRTEVWGQLTDHLNDGPEPLLDERHVLAWFLDPAIEHPNPSEATNAEPLLINTPGSWADRPDAATRIPNLLLAADYVRTYTDLATMEGANEAARRAVNAILDKTGSRAARCAIFRLREPPVLAPARKLDELRWRLFRRPAQSPLRVAGDGGVEPRGLLSRATLAAGAISRRRG